MEILDKKSNRMSRVIVGVLHSDTPAFAWLILFDFLSKISIRNSFIFYFSIEI